MKHFIVLVLYHMIPWTLVYSPASKTEDINLNGSCVSKSERHGTMAMVNSMGTQWPKRNSKSDV